MELPNTFYEGLRRKSEQELATIAFSIEEYVPEARHAAQAELKNRGVSTERFKDIQKKAEAIEVEKYINRRETLSWRERLLCLLIPGAALIFFRDFKNTEFSSKASEAASYMVLHIIVGFVFHFTH